MGKKQLKATLREGVRDPMVVKFVVQISRRPGTPPMCTCPD
jgi:hypothetical protein